MKKALSPEQDLWSRKLLLDLSLFQKVIRKFRLIRKSIPYSGGFYTTLSFPNACQRDIQKYFI